MRLWSLHPQLLDPRGSVACWREGLLASNVLQGKTAGYRNHPQLNRFKQSADPIQQISNYLHSLCDDADDRDYNFNRSKIPNKYRVVEKIPVTVGQIDYEFKFLKQKVLLRTGNWKYGDYRLSECVNPTFYVVHGGIESWEKVK